MNLALARIRRDGGTQSREVLNPEVVDDYGNAMLAGVVFPPVVVFHDGTEYWLGDGFHRVEAASAVGVAELVVDVRQGTRRDAVLFSVGANAQHGLRRTNADKRRAVQVVLADAEWSKWSDRKIAETCGVSHTLVAQLRRPNDATRGNGCHASSPPVPPSSGTRPVSTPPRGASSTPAPPVSSPVSLDDERAKRDASNALAAAAEHAIDEAVRAVRAALADPKAAPFVWNRLEEALPVLQRLARRTG